MRQGGSGTVATLMVAAVVLAAVRCERDGRPELTLGIPTTVQDSGLLAALLPSFEASHPGIRLRYSAAGSGELVRPLT